LTLGQFSVGVKVVKALGLQLTIDPLGQA